MTFKTSLFWWWLGILNRRRYEALMQAYGNLDDVRQELDASLLRNLGLQEKTIPTVLDRIHVFNEEDVLKKIGMRDVRLVNIEDELYPTMLKEIADPPIFLSYIGDFSLVDQSLLGIVGTRRMSPYGRRVVQEFIPPIVRQGFVTVSGLALGVDAAVAKDTLASNGKTIAVLGHGLGSIYPTTNRKLADDILAQGGLLISEFPLEQPPDTYTFPARNRIIAGLSLGTLVCEAPEDSGAIITAELALEYGRDVFAVPGQIFDEQFAGCHRLIAHGQAKLVTNAEDVLNEFVVHVDEAEQVAPFMAATIEEELVYRTLTAMPQSMDSLVTRTGFDASRIGTVLTMMELAGVARNVGAGQWVRRS